jgi:transcriptional regulator with XRE-family HTH domain
MKSKRSTTVAVLRQDLGLSVEEFAKLIDKSVATINSLETGRLNLSEETAFKIQQQTGVEMEWLLKAGPREKPYVLSFEGYGARKPYTKELFEQIQSSKGRKSYYLEGPQHHLIPAISIVSDWISVYTAAEQTGRGDLAAYLMCQFLDQLVERMGKNDDLFFRLNKNAKIVANDGSEWKFAKQKNEGSEEPFLTLVPTKTRLKTLPSRP